MPANVENRVYLSGGWILVGVRNPLGLVGRVLCWVFAFLGWIIGGGTLCFRTGPPLVNYFTYVQTG